MLVSQFDSAIQALLGDEQVPLSMIHDEYTEYGSMPYLKLNFLPDGTWEEVESRTHYYNVKNQLFYVENGSYPWMDWKRYQTPAYMQEYLKKKPYDALDFNNHFPGLIPEENHPASSFTLESFEHHFNIRNGVGLASDPNRKDPNAPKYLEPNISFEIDALLETDAPFTDPPSDPKCILDEKELVVVTLDSRNPVHAEYLRNKPITEIPKTLKDKVVANLAIAKKVGGKGIKEKAKIEPAKKRAVNAFIAFRMYFQASIRANHEFIRSKDESDVVGVIKAMWTKVPDSDKAKWATIGKLYSRKRTDSGITTEALRQFLKSSAEEAGLISPQLLRSYLANNENHGIQLLESDSTIGQQATDKTQSIPISSLYRGVPSDSGLRIDDSSMHWEASSLSPQTSGVPTPCLSPAPSSPTRTSQQAPTHCATIPLSPITLGPPPPRTPQIQTDDKISPFAPRSVKPKAAASEQKEKKPEPEWEYNAISKRARSQVKVNFVLEQIRSELERQQALNSSHAGDTTAETAFKRTYKPVPRSQSPLIPDSECIFPHDWYKLIRKDKTDGSRWYTDDRLGTKINMTAQQHRFDAWHDLFTDGYFQRCPDAKRLQTKPLKKPTARDIWLATGPDGKPKCEKGKNIPDKCPA